MLALIERIAPEFLAKKAYKALSEPKVKKLREHEQAVLKASRQSSLKFKHFDIQRYTWGFGPKHALLVHGWEGQAGNFSALIPILVDGGYTVHAFDAPSHGNSTQARTSLFDYSEVVTLILNERNFETIITHSFGSVPLTLALSELGSYPLNRLMLITTPDRFEDRLNQILRELKLTMSTGNRVVEKLKAQTGQDPLSMSVSKYCEAIRPNHSMILHGENDKVLPMEWSERISKVLPNCHLQTIPDTGHYRILFDKRTQEIVSDFIRK